MVLVTAVLFFIGLAVLVKGADFFIEGAAKIAKAFGVSPFVIGLTLVAVGTSLPELASSFLAAHYGASELAVGTVVGSNIANITLVAAISALVLGRISASRKIFDKDCMVVLISAVLFYAVAIDGVVSMLDGVVLLCFFVAYLAVLFKVKPNIASIFNFDTYLWMLHPGKNGTIRRLKGEGGKPGVSRKSVAMLVVGVVAIAVGAQLTVDNATALADAFGISSGFVGLTLVAVGTSMPELVVSVTSMRKGLAGIMLGNVLGSNIANILLIAGATALISPLAIADAVTTPMVFMIIASTLLFIFVYGDWHIDRKEALVLLSIYLLFIYQLAVGAM